MGWTAKRPGDDGKPRYRATWLAPGSVEGRRGPQDFIRPPQVAVLPLEFGDPTCLVAGDARPVAFVDLGLLHPVAQRLGIDPELLTDPPQRFRPSRRVPPQVDRQPDRLAPEARPGTSSVLP